MFEKSIGIADKLTLLYCSPFGQSKFALLRGNVFLMLAVVETTVSVNLWLREILKTVLIKLTLRLFAVTKSKACRLRNKRKSKTIPQLSIWFTQIHCKCKEFDA